LGNNSIANFDTKACQYQAGSSRKLYQGTGETSFLVEHFWEITVSQILKKRHKGTEAQRRQLDVLRDLQKENTSIYVNGFSKKQNFRITG
jgi:hypothetical protein